MLWLKTTFNEYAKKRGINLLKDDFKFIEKVLSQIPQNLHKSVMIDYCDKWLHDIENKKTLPKIKILGDLKQIPG